MCTLYAGIETNIAFGPPRGPTIFFIFLQNYHIVDHVEQMPRFITSHRLLFVFSALYTGFPSHTSLHS
jgi:hypothetical protein